MADDKKEATGKEKKEAKAPVSAEAAAKAGGGLPMGALVAGAVLLALGGGLGVGGSMVVAKWAGGTAETKAAGGEHAAKPTEGEHGAGGKTLHEMSEIALPDLMSNIRNQQGRRFVKISCAIYIVTEDAVKLGLASAGGGHGGGGDAGANIKRIMQQSLEEHLKNYDMDELTGPNIYQQLKKGFRDALERSLHEVFPHEPADKTFVERVVLTNLLVQ